METTLPTLIEQFVAQKRVEGLTERTVGWYRRQLETFARYLGDDARIRDLTLDNARSFIAYLQAKEARYEGNGLRPVEPGKLSDYTVHGYVRALKAFSAWLEREERTARDVFARLKRPKLPETMIDVLTDEEIERLFATVNPKTALGARMHLILLILLDTGIRASELLGLQLEDVDLKGEVFKVFGKGRKERIVPFGMATKQAMMRYISTYRPEPANMNIGELILTAEGRSLSYKSLDQAIKRLGQKAGVPRLHPHLCRHTMAVKFLINSNGDLMTLKRILGHTSVIVTEKYLHIANTHIREQHAKYSLMDRLGIGSKKQRRA
jgi:integrase/recombinase XerC/integrase/recombinase XerD